MNTLDLVLKHKWYNLIESGIKKEEYRELKSFYFKRLLKNSNKVIELPKNIEFKDYDIIRFHKGYSSVTMLVECKGIYIGYGKYEWGAPKNKEVFIIKLGDVLKRT